MIKIIYCSDGYWFGSIDITSKDDNPAWVLMGDIQELADDVHLPNKSVCPPSRAIFL